MRHLAWRCAGLLLILLANAACHKDSSVAMYPSLYSGDYMLNPVAMLGSTSSELPLLLAESYGSYILGLSEMEAIVASSEVETASTNDLSSEPPALPPVVPSSLFRFPYDISFRCVGVPCQGVMLSGSADLIIDLNKESISLESIDARSADNKFHLTASLKRGMSVLTSSELVSGSFTMADMSTHELSRSATFVMIDEYTKDTLVEKIIPESEMRIDTTAGFYFTGEGMGQ